MCGVVWCRQSQIHGVLTVHRTCSKGKTRGIYYGLVHFVEQKTSCPHLGLEIVNEEAQDVELHPAVDRVDVQSVLFSVIEPLIRPV